MTFPSAPGHAPGPRLYGSGGGPDWAALAARPCVRSSQASGRIRRRWPARASWSTRSARGPPRAAGVRSGPGPPRRLRPGSPRAARCWQAAAASVGHRHPVDHPLQRPARADHQRAGGRRSRRRPASTSTCAATTRTPSPTRSSPRARARPPTCSSPRTPALENLQARVCSPAVDASTLRRHPGQVQLTAGGLGRRLRPGQRAHLQPGADPASQLPTSVIQLADPKYKGKLAVAPGRDRLPADRHRGSGPTARPRRCSWLKGSRRTPAGTSTPTTRRSLTR